MRFPNSIVIFALAVVVFATLETSAKKPFGNSPKAVANRFYQACLQNTVNGLPTEEQMETFAPLLSSELIDLISAAREKKKKFLLERPKDKPPWDDSSLFCSNIEGFTSFSLGAPLLNDDKASVPVYLEYREGKSIARWVDVLILERRHDEWRICEIFMNAPWEFRSGLTLSGALSPD